MPTDEELSASLAAHGRDLAHWVSPDGKMDPEWIAKARSLLQPIQEELNKAAGDGGAIIGDRDAFPPCLIGFRGMTYRQWLIGQALAGTMAYPQQAEAKTERDAWLAIGRTALSAADATLELLDSEIIDEKVKEK